MGFVDDAKETAEATAKKASRTLEDNTDRVKGKVAEIEANAKLKEAEAEQQSVSHRNSAKEQLRVD